MSLFRGRFSSGALNVHFPNRHRYCLQADSKATTAASHMFQSPAHRSMTALLWLSTSSRCLRFLWKQLKYFVKKITNILLSESTPKKISNLSTNPSNLTTYDFNKTSLLVYHPKNFPKFPDTIDISQQQQPLDLFTKSSTELMHLEVGFVRQKWWDLENVDGEPSLSHRIHGTGVFTYIWLIFVVCWQIYHSWILWVYILVYKVPLLTYLLVSVNTWQERIPWEKHGTNLLLAGVYCISIAGDDRERFQLFSSWWFQPIGKTLVKLDHFPRQGWK